MVGFGAVSLTGEDTLKGLTLKPIAKNISVVIKL